MHVRVAAEPALLVHVRPALQAQRQFALARRDRQARAQRLVLEAARHIHDHIAARQPALARAVDVRVRDLPQAQVAADVDMPGAEVGVHVVMVAVRLVGHAIGRAEVHAAGRGLAALVVEHRHMHPVLAVVDDLDAHARCVDHAMPGDLAPAHAPQFCVTLFERDRCRGDCRDLDVGRAGLRVLCFAPAAVRIGDELVGARLGQRVGIGRHPAIHLHVEVERLLRVGRVAEHDARCARALAHERRLVEQTQCDRRDDEARPARDKRERLDRRVGFGIAPGPQVVVARVALVRFRQTLTRGRPASRVARFESVLLVGQRAKGQVAPTGRDDANLEALADGHAHIHAGHTKDVLRHRFAQRAALFQPRLQQPVRDDDVIGRLLDGHMHAGAGCAAQFNKTFATGLSRSDLERQPVKRLPAQYGLRIRAQHLQTRVAPGR